MADAVNSAVPGRRRRRKSSGRRSPVQVVVQVIGELLITLGLVALLFVGWELWWTNIESNQKQEEALTSLFEEFELPAAAPSASPEANSGEENNDDAEPPVLDKPEYGETFAVVYVPRFGKDHARPVTSGVGVDVLDSLGLGHYPGTQMPGEVGNFAVAGHRQTHGQVLDLIHTLVPGDKIYVQTKDGYYTYTFRNNHIVMPDRVDVIAPVPTKPEAEPTERYLTMTACNPRYGATERIIAYAVMESWQPMSEGPPAEIAERVAEYAAAPAGSGS
ncbi:class E sortase [Arthrobacter sp. VKM Ac-2550]|uniref:class E sortase n=1 Tax=Crystallibacter permensis TaxID=1938888 RepID=UPI002226430B|nr:class E sortase [Arthrobacter sp. VKM Ac-2550]MCW2131146.1 sortase A [Arthrobacter sp. VKM Ac-2550]